MFGVKVGTKKPQIVSAGDDEMFVLKNAFIVGAQPGQSFVLSIHPGGSPSAFALCELNSASKHALLDVPFEGDVEISLEPSPSGATATVHLVGQRISDNSMGGDDEDEKDGDKEAHMTEAPPMLAKIQKRAGPSSEAPSGARVASFSEEESSDEGEEEAPLPVDKRVPEPQTEEEYVAALVQYLRQHGTTTLVKLGGAIKKPKCVKKSLGKFVATIKATQGKRRGTTLEVDGDKVHLIMKSNYAEPDSQTKPGAKKIRLAGDRGIRRGVRAGKGMKAY